MPYTVHQLAELANISARTLHHYDQIGLLKPFRATNGYRHYNENDLLKLQQILFFRELNFPLTEIKEILTAKDFNMMHALQDQKKLLSLQKKRLGKLITTIETTIHKINQNIPMNDQELYNTFSDNEIDQYAAEAKQRWGNTKAYQQSQVRYGKLTKAQKGELKKQSEKLLQEIASLMKLPPSAKEVQLLITKHYEGLRNFYDPNPTIYRGLANMYIEDSRFTAHYEQYAFGLAQFMHDAMIVFCDAQNS